MDQHLVVPHSEDRQACGHDLGSDVSVIYRRRKSVQDRVWTEDVSSVLTV